MKFTDLTALCLIFSTAVAAAEQPSPEELTATLRQSLEEQFESSTGLHFSSFQCNMEGDFRPRMELTCDATDEEGDYFTYRLVVKDQDQPPVVKVFQPIDQLNPAGREMLERPCLAFLGAFERADWLEAYNGLSPELQGVISPAEFEASLEPIKQALGDLQDIEAKSYSSPSPGLHVLEYALTTEGGDGVARFRLQLTNDEQAQIIAFLVTARPGSALQAKLLSESGRQTLTPLLGQPVKQIKAPLSSLELLGDAVEGIAVMADGKEVPIRVEQHGTAYDLDGNDYRFQVLDVSWLIRQYLVSTGVEAAEIDCPAPTAPDGGEIECAATMEDGSRRQITIARRGGDHRLVQ